MDKFIMLLALLIFIHITFSLAATNEEIECKGQIAFGNITWNPQNFAGFFYDIDNDIGTEEIVATINGTNKLSGENPYGIIYKTIAQNEDFKFKGWGNYRAIGFLGDKYFVGYNEYSDSDKNFLYSMSNYDELLLDDILLKILRNENTETLLEIGVPLKLEEGYSLVIQEIDVTGNKLRVRLIDKYGKILNQNEVYSPSNNPLNVPSSTVYYSNNLIGKNRLVIIAVHFKELFTGLDSQGYMRHYGVIDGVWQLSENYTQVRTDDFQGKLKLRTKVTDEISITGDNREHSVDLIRNRDINLIDAFKIKVADCNILKYYIYKQYLDPRSYEIRSTVATSDYIWNPQNFAGFYYDIDTDLNTENISTHINNRKLSGNEPYGLVYNTHAQKKDFDFEDWGCYDAIGFLGKEYFAGYTENINTDKNLFYQESRHPESLAKSDQLEEVLINSNTDSIYTLGNYIPLDINQGYTLLVKELDIDGNKVKLELRDKNGTIVSNGSISSSNDIADSTYIYKKDVGDQDKLVIIAVHIKNALRGPDTEIATVDGVWQISDKPTKISVDSQFDKMRVTNVDNSNKTITMCNVDKEINLRKDKVERIIYDPKKEWPPKKDISLMGNIWLRTADNEALRYYLFHLESINSTLTVNSNPENASISIDGDYKGVTPREVGISSGSHRIEIKKEGYVSDITYKNISNKLEYVTANLTREPCNISLEIYPPYAKVYVDGSLLEKKYLLIEADIPHVVYVAQDNYRPYNDTIICNGKADRLKIELDSNTNITAPALANEGDIWTKLSALFAAFGVLIAVPPAIVAIIWLLRRKPPAG